MIKKIYINLQFLNFLIVGTSAAFVNWTMRIILNLYLDFTLSVMVSYLFAFIYAFTLNLNFVFKNRKRKILKLIQYFFSNLFFFPIVLIISVFLNNLLMAYNFYFHSELAHAIAISVPACISFLIYKFIIFKDN